MIRATLLLATVTLVLAGCGGGGDDEASTTATTAAGEGKTFEVAGVGFTFTYPEDFEQVEDPNDGKVLAAVTPTPDDVKHGLKVRKTSDKELIFSSYSDQFRRQFEDQLKTKVTVTTEEHNGIDFGVMDWSRKITYQDLGQEETTTLRSTSYFFRASGKTWQLECISAIERRDEIDAACQQALDSIEPR